MSECVSIDDDATNFWIKRAVVLRGIISQAGLKFQKQLGFHCVAMEFGGWLNGRPIYHLTMKIHHTFPLPGEKDRVKMISHSLQDTHIST